MREFSDQELVRREKAENIRNMGMDPFGQKFDRKDFAMDIKEKYKEWFLAETRGKVESDVEMAKKIYGDSDSGRAYKETKKARDSMPDYMKE